MGIGFLHHQHQHQKEEGRMSNYNRIIRIVKLNCLENNSSRTGIAIIICNLYGMWECVTSCCCCSSSVYTTTRRRTNVNDTELGWVVGVEESILRSSIKYKFTVCRCCSAPAAKNMQICTTPTHSSFSSSFPSVDPPNTRNGYG